MYLSNILNEKTKQEKKTPKKKEIYIHYIVQTLHDGKGFCVHLRVTFLHLQSVARGEQQKKMANEHSSTLMTCH